MSDTPMDPTETRQDDDLQDGGAGRRADLDVPASDVEEGDDVSTGTDGVGGGNDSTSSVLADTLGAGGDQDEVDRGL